MYMSVVMLSISRSPVDCNSMFRKHFDHKGLCQVQNSFVPDKDPRGQNVLLQSTVLREMLNITTDIEAVAMSLYYITCT